MFSTQFLYALAAGLIPSLVWLFFWTREDSAQPEPRSVLAGCFLAGILAVLLAIPVEQFLSGLTTDSFARYTLWAAAEEILKFMAVAIAALHLRFNDEPIDAMIYCISVALGFAALENTLFIMNSLAHGGTMATSIITGNMRFIGATLVHTVSSALIGFGLGFAFYRGGLAKFLGWVVGLAGAIAIHTSFNLAITGGGSTDTLRAFGWIWGAVVIIIVLFEEVKAVKPKVPVV